jgi:hypothetical protein
MLGVDSTTSVGVLLLSGPARSCSFFFSARFGLSSLAGLSTCDEFDFLLVDFGFATVAAAGPVVALWFVLRFTAYHRCRAIFHSAAHRSSIPLATAGAHPDFFFESPDQRLEFFKFSLCFRGDFLITHSKCSMKCS